MPQQLPFPLFKKFEAKLIIEAMIAKKTDFRKVLPKHIKKLREEDKRKQDQRKQNNKENYDKIYEKKIEYKFPDVNSSKYNPDKYFYIPKKLFKLNLSKSALSIYPVLCSRADFKVDEPFQISLNNLSKISGLSIPTISKAIKELNVRGILKRTLKKKGKRTFYIYNIVFIRKKEIEDNRGNLILFYNYILDSQIWSKLHPRAKALYLSMRYYAVYDGLELRYELGYEYGEINTHSPDFKYRKYDMCRHSITDICNLVNIESSNIKYTIKELINCGLIDIENEDFFCAKVYLKPKIDKY